MSYYLSHGIASCIRVVDPDHREWTAINMASGVEWFAAGRSSNPLTSCPVPDWVARDVARRFREVADLPIDKRGAYCSHDRIMMTKPAGPFNLADDDAFDEFGRAHR